MTGSPLQSPPPVGMQPGMAPAPDPRLAAPTSETPEFIQYLRAILSRWLLILVLSVLATVAGALFVKTTTPMFTAEAVIKYEPNAQRIVEFGEIGRTVNSFDEIKTQVELIESPAVTKAVIDALGLMESSGGKIEKVTFLDRVRVVIADARKMVRSYLVAQTGPPVSAAETFEQEFIANLQYRTRVSQILDTKLIRLRVDDPDPRRAAHIADEFCRQYILSLNSAKSESYRYARDYLLREVEEAKRRLEAAERARYEYKGQTDLRVLEQNLDIAITTMKSISEQIESTRNDLAVYRAQSSASDIAGVKESLLEGDPDFARMKSKLTELLIEQAALSADYQTDFPRLRQVSRQVEAINDLLTSKTMSVVDAAAGRAALAEMTLDQLATRRSQQEEIVRAIKGEMITYGVLQRDVQTETELYNSLLTRFKEVDVSSEVEASNVSIVSPATVPRFPTTPRVLRTIFLFAFGGFNLGCLIALGLHRLDRTVREPARIEALYGFPTLAVVPFVSTGLRLPRLGRAKRGQVPLVTKLDNYAPAAEAYRLLRTALQYSTAGHSPQVIVVSSCMPQEGKSTTSANLAISLAGRGGKALLIDADLKMPTGHRIFQANRTPGLSDVLTGQHSLEAAIVGTGIDNLDLLPAGPPAPSPVDLLDSDAMSDLITKLRERYQCIVLDAAPLVGLSDTFVLARKADGLCLVASVGKTRLDLLRKTFLQLNALNIRVLGVVYNNQVRGRASAEQYGYGYGGKYRRYDPSEDAEREPAGASSSSD